MNITHIRIQNCRLNSINVTTVTSTPRTKPSFAQRIIEKDLIDECHPIVKELLKLDYDVQESIHAAERCKDLNDAMDYLAGIDDDIISRPINER